MGRFVIDIYGVMMKILYLLATFSNLWLAFIAGCNGTVNLAPVPIALDGGLKERFGDRIELKCNETRKLVPLLAGVTLAQFMFHNTDTRDVVVSISDASYKHVYAGRITYFSWESDPLKTIAIRVLDSNQNPVDYRSDLLLDSEYQVRAIAAALPVGDFIIEVTGSPQLSVQSLCSGGIGDVCANADTPWEFCYANPCINGRC